MSERADPPRDGPTRRTTMLNGSVAVAELLLLLVQETDTDHRYNRRVRHVRPTADVVDAWCTETGLQPTELFNQLGLALARAYDAGDLSFTVCDFIANDLVSYMQERLGETDPFWKVYWAFDSGEYFHDNNHAEDPEETYTRPMIREILRRADQG